MTFYLRTGSSPDAIDYETEQAAITQVHVNIARQRAHGRVVARNGEKIEFREPTGELFDTMWVEDEDEKHIHIPDA